MGGVETALHGGLVWSMMSLVLMTAPGVLTFPQGVAPESPQKPETILESYIVRSDIHYRYATTLVSSRVENPTDKMQRVNFTVIVPENAYISSFVMDVGGQLYETIVTERTQPDVEFADGRLNEIEALRLRDSNVFRASVCLAPGGTIASFYLTYEELLQRRMGAYQHVINLHPGQVAREMKVEVIIREGRNISALRVPSIRSGHEIDQNTADTDDLIEVTQPTSTEAHIKLNPTPEQQEKWKGQWKNTKSQRERLAQRGQGKFTQRGVEGQLVVLYDVARDPYYSGDSGGEVVVRDGYFVHFFSPANLPLFNRHLVLVIDVSESMSGKKMKHLKTALADILDGLKRTEYFSIIKFNNRKSVWNPYSKEARKYEIGGGRVVPATTKYLTKAKKHLKKLSTSGGTNMFRGLLKGLSVARDSRKVGGNSTLFPMIVLVTDGEKDVGSPDSKSDDTKPDSGGAGNLAGTWEIPIFCLGYVPDSDMPLLKAISRRSAGGWARRIYEASDTDIQISELHAESAWPVLGGVRFTYSKNMGGLEVDPITLTHTRFYATVSGSELVVAGRLKGNFEEDMEMNKDPNTNIELIDEHDDGATLSGYVSAMSAKGRALFPFRSTVASSSFPIDRFWAYLMVNQLTELEAAQKTWGTYWTEKSLNGITTPAPNEKDPPNSKESNHSVMPNNFSYLVTSAKQMAMHYSFVSPGMTLGFADIKDDAWDYTDHRAMDYESVESNPDWGGATRMHGRHGRTRRNARSSRPRVHKPAETNHGMSGRMRYDDNSYNRGGGCTDKKEGIFWSALPYNPRPSSLCQIKVHNLTCPESTSDRYEHREKYPLVKSLAELTWMKDVKRGANLVLPKGYRGSESHFKLGLGQEDKQHEKCKTPSGVPGHCRHLNYCLLKDFATDYNYFLKFFCHIEGTQSFVGVCCPDYLYKNKQHHG